MTVGRLVPPHYLKSMGNFPDLGMRLFVDREG
jgi:hypothetical protein